MSKSIQFLDKTFWITESKDNPKHVASLQLLEMPDNAPEGYLDKLVEKLRSHNKAVAPFNYRVKSIGPWPIKFVPVEELDMDYHVQVVEIEDVSDKEELHKLIARL